MLSDGIPQYEDRLLKGVLVNEQKVPLFLFTRTSTGLMNFTHYLAQIPNGQVFKIQEFTPQGIFSVKKLILRMIDHGGNPIEWDVMRWNTIEQPKGAIFSFMEKASLATKTLTDPDLKDWTPLTEQTLKDFCIWSLGVFLSEGKVMPIPSSWLKS